MIDTTTELIEGIRQLCVENALSYDGTPPVGVSPGIYMFYATEMNVKCKTMGQCRERAHYVIIKGNELALG